MAGDFLMHHNTDTTLKILICTPLPQAQHFPKQDKILNGANNALPNLDGLVSICFLSYSPFNSQVFCANSMSRMGFSLAASPIKLMMMISSLEFSLYTVDCVY